MVFIVVIIAISHGVNGHLETDSLILSLLYSIYSRECYRMCMCLFTCVCRELDEWALDSVPLSLSSSSSSHSEGSLLWEWLETHKQLQLNRVWPSSEDMNTPIWNLASFTAGSEMYFSIKGPYYYILISRGIFSICEGNFYNNLILTIFKNCCQ